MRGAILSLCLLQTVLLAVAYSQPAVLSDFAAARQRMVEEQLSAPGRDIKNRLVLEAMATVPRHEFVPESLRKFAYWDEPLPIGYGQTISQPFIVAFMTEQLNHIDPQHMAAIQMLFSWLNEKGVLANASGSGSQDREIFADGRQNAGIR